MILRRTATKLFLFSLAMVVAYLAAFKCIEYLRHRHGPWEVQFTSNGHGSAEIIVSQPHLKISRLNIIFDEKIPLTNLSEKIIFDRPLLSIPFGKLIYEDLTSLPGVVTLDFFGHEIELLPRTLIVNRQEIPWQPEMTVTLSSSNKPAGLPTHKRS